MAKVTLTANLKKYYPQGEDEVSGANLAEVLASMDQKREYFRTYILEDDGTIRVHVNIFVDGELVREKRADRILVEDSSHIHIMQALSGG